MKNLLLADYQFLRVLGKVETPEENEDLDGISTVKELEDRRASKNLAPPDYYRFTIHQALDGGYDDIEDLKNIREALTTLHAILDKVIRDDEKHWVDPNTIN